MTALSVLTTKTGRMHTACRQGTLTENLIKTPLRQQADDAETQKTNQFMKKFITFLTLIAAFMLPQMSLAYSLFDFDSMDHASSSGQGATAVTDGDITAEEGETFTVNGVSVTVSPKDPSNSTANRFWTTSPRLRCYSGTITVTAEEPITTITFTGHATNFNLSTTEGTLDGKVWTGSATSVTFAVGGNTQISTIAVQLNGEAAPLPELPEAANIAAFKALDANTEAILTLTNVQVNKVSGNNVYIQDATGGLLLYNAGLTFEEGTILNGILIGKITTYQTMPEFIAGTYTSRSDFTATATETLAAINAKIEGLATEANIYQLYTIKGIQIVEEDSKYYAVDGENRIQIYDQFKVNPTYPEYATLSRVILGMYGGNYQLYPLTAEDIVEITTETVNLDFSESTPTSVVVRTYQKDIKNDDVAQLQPVEGWTIVENGDARAGAVFAYGSDVLLGGEGYPTPKAGPTGETGNALGIVGVWTGHAQYTQTVVLSAGKYAVTVPVFNSVGGTTAIEKNLIGVAIGETEYYATAKTYAVNTWTYEIITFDVESPVVGVLSLGYKAANQGSAAMPHLFIDRMDVKVFESDEAREAYLETVAAEEAKVQLTLAIEAAEATAGNEELVGDNLFQVNAESFNAAIADAKAVLNNPDATKEEIEAAIASLNTSAHINKPDADKQYTFQLKDGGNFMSLNEGTKLAAEPVGLSFVEMENGYAITNGEEYAALTGTGSNTWSMGLCTEPFAWNVTLIGDGYYTIAQAGKTGSVLIGVDETEAGKSCYANKSQNDKSLWKIKEVSDDAVTFTITIADTENGTVTADKEEAAENDIVTLTVTPAEGYKLETLTVTTADETEVTVTDNAFRMPASDVTVSATFAERLVVTEKPVPAFSPLADDGNTVQYLYNVEAGAFMVGANDWGTRASVDEGKGYKFKVAKNEDGATWTLNDYVENQNAWKAVFAGGKGDIWVDNLAGANVNGWVITSIGDNKYEITNPAAAEGKLAAHTYLHDTRVYLGEGTPLGGTWAFVSEEDYAQYLVDYAAWLEYVPNLLQSTTLGADITPAVGRITTSMDGWSIDNASTFHINTWSWEGMDDGTWMTPSFLENWCAKDAGLLPAGTWAYTIKGLVPGQKYVVSAYIRAYNEGSDATPAGAYFYAGEGQSVDISEGTAFKYNGMPGVYGTFAATAVADEDGNLTIGVVLVDGEANFNWIAVRDIVVEVLGEEPESPCLKTYDLSVTDVALGDYTAETLAGADIINEAAGLLNATPEELTFQLVNADGTVDTEYNGNPGEVLFWVTSDGQKHNFDYGNEAKYFVKYDVEVPAILVFQYGAVYEGQLNAVVRLANAAGQYVEFNISETMMAKPEINVEIVKTIEIEHHELPGAAYSEVEPSPTFDVAEVCEALGIEDINEAKAYIVNVTTGEFVENTTDGWRDANGDAAPWAEATNGFCLKLEDMANGVFGYTGAHDDNFQTGDEYVAQWGIVANGKAVILRVTVYFDYSTGINGLTIDTNAANIYDLQGRKVQNVVKGQIYIVNGKKVMVK